MNDKAEHVEWVFREACHRHMNDARKGNGGKKSKWFLLADALEDLFPDEINAYRDRIYVPRECVPTGSREPVNGNAGGT